MANAGCINAIGFDGCFLRTLQCLDSSNIGVGVQYTAPNPLDDKRFDYITYTDKCGCQCCLTDENEILIYATQGVIKNLTLTNDDENEAVIVKWTDLFGSNWNKTVVRYKTGSYPSSPTDGTLAVEETTQNQYQTNGYSVGGLTDGTTYYFSVFALDGDGTTINVQSMNITPSFDRIPGNDIIVYWKLEGDTNDYSGHNRTGTANSITYESNGNIQVAKFVNSSYVQRQDSAFDIYGATPYTYSGRFKPTSFPTGSYYNSFGMHENGSPSTQDKAIEILPNGIAQGYIWDGNVKKATSPSGTLQLNQRYNLTSTFDGTILKIYVNAELKGSVAVSQSYNFSNPVLRLSRQTGDCQSFIGYASRFWLSNKARTVTEITNYVNKIKSKYGLI